MRATEYVIEKSDPRQDGGGGGVFEIWQRMLLDGKTSNAQPRRLNECERSSVSRTPRTPAALTETYREHRVQLEYGCASSAGPLYRSPDMAMTLYS